MEKTVVHIALFAGLIAVLGLVPKIDLLSGVPITAQSMGIMLCGTVLGAKRGALAVLLFLGLTAVGLPLLSGYRGGLGVFVGPSAGFLIGFPIAAFVGGLIVEKWDAPIALSAFVASLVGGVFVLYAFGIPGMKIVLGKTWLEAMALATPFFAGDVIKATLTAMITHTIAKARPSALLSRA